MVTLKKREYEIKSANNEKSCFVYDSQYKTINNALQKIRDEIPEAISCVLYGSCSRSESKYESDVDLMVLLDNFDGDVQRKGRNLISELNSNVIVNVDVVFCRKERFDSDNSTYYNSIKRDGIVLW